MKLSTNFLKDYVDIDVDLHTLAVQVLKFHPMISEKDVAMDQVFISSFQKM